MAHHIGREPLRRIDPPNHQLSHRISSLSEISDFASGPYESDESYHAPSHLSSSTRASLVSLDSHQSHTNLDPYDLEPYGHANATAPSWAGSFTYLSSGGYSPVSASPSGSVSKSGHRTSMISGLRRLAPETINEEEYDMSLLRSAEPMGTAAPRYDKFPEDEPIPPGFDLTTYQGPISSQDEGFLRKLQAQEAKGTLTLGLGQGFRLEKVSHQDLLSSPIVERRLSRSLSRRRSNKPLGRAETIRVAGQDEANRRGEVIQVIIEEPAEADISTIEGPKGIATDQSRRQSTIALQKHETQTFYPQPNWKPFSMRWPFLSILIITSASLAVMQEFLFQRYTGNNPLLRFKTPDEVDAWLYFLVKFGPTLVAVVYGVLWQFLDFEVRRLEAYYQMSRKGGALAAESINVDYVTCFSFFRPFLAMKLGHNAVALSSLATTFAVSLVPTFASASLILTPNRHERLQNPLGDKEIQFSPIWSRLLSSTLLINSFAGCALFYLLQTRRSGLLADVRGIAGLASMAVVSHILMDFRDCDTAKPKDIHLKLKQHRYVLRNSSLAPDHENPPSSLERDKYRDINLSSNPHPLMLRPAGSIPFIVSLLAFTGFIPAFLFSKAEVVTDKAPWVVTALAICLKLSWGALDTSLRMIEPFYRLSKRHAPPKTLTLDYTALPFGYLPIEALLNGHTLMFMVGFGTVMAEWLTILVTGLATVAGSEFLPKSGKTGQLVGDEDDGNTQINSGQETVTSFYWSLAATLFILLYMIFVATIVFFKRRHPFLPRQPNTIASILAFIHQSKMLYNFVGTTKLSKTEMVRKLDNGATYGLGWFIGRDGKTHCGIDQEELVSHYKHGIDDSQRNEPWNTRWDIL